VDSAGYYAIVVPAEVAASVGADRKLGLVVSSGAERVSAELAALTLAAGTVQVQDVQLPASALDVLKLRLPPTLDLGKVVPSRSAGVAAKSSRRTPAPKRSRGGR
jgi:hypothetical protein